MQTVICSKNQQSLHRQQRHTEPVASHSDHHWLQAPATGLWWGHIPPRCTQPLYSRFEMQNDTPAQKLPTPPNDRALCLSPADVRKTLSRINPRKAAGPDNIPGPCTERLCCTADGCPNRYLQHLAEPGSRPHMSQIHNNHTGTKEITCVLSKWLPSHSTDSNHDEVLWEVSHEQHQKQPPQHTWPAAVCIPSKPLYGRCNLLHPPPGSYPPRK